MWVTTWDECYKKSGKCPGIPQCLEGGSACVLAVPTVSKNLCIYLNVDTVAGWIGDIPASILQPGGPCFLSADSHLLRSRHLLLRCCHGDDGNYREADLDTVCQLISVICFVAVEYDLCVVVVIQEVWLSHMIRVMFRN